MDSENTLMAAGIHRALYEQGWSRLGDAAAAALIAYVGGARPFATELQYNLLGDPATGFSGTNGLPASGPCGPPGPVGYDEWLRLNFAAVERGRPLAQPAADPDADGLDNAAEFAAGTDPRDGASRLWISGVSVAASGDVPATVRFDWPSVAARFYAVQIATNLWEGFQPYTNGLPATPPLNVHTCAVDAAGPVYLRVTVE
jgi:hypothetical protein